MFSLRALLEPHAARLAAERATDADIAELNRINAEMAGSIRSRSDDAVLRIQVANRAFRMHLLECAKSQRLKSMLVTLIDMPVIMRSFSLYSAPHFARSLQQHEDIAYAVQTHDGQPASNLMESHIRLPYRRFMKEPSTPAMRPTPQPEILARHDALAIRRRTLRHANTKKEQFA